MYSVYGIRLGYDFDPFPQVPGLTSSRYWIILCHFSSFTFLSS